MEGAAHLVEPGPEDVELLFDGDAPEIAGGVGWDVVVGGVDIAGHEEEGEHEAQVGRLAGDEEGHDRHEEDEAEVERPDAEGAPDVEVADGDGAGGVLFALQEFR